MAPTLGELAQRVASGLPGLELRGDASVEIRGVCALSPGEPGCVAFLANPRLKDQLGATKAAAVVLSPRDAAGFAGNALLFKDPHLAFARLAAQFDFSKRFTPGVHPSAVVAAGVAVPPGAHVGPGAVIGAGATIGDAVYVGPGCVVGEGVALGEGTRLEARVVVDGRARLGRRCHVNSGAVIGGRGFGLARGPAGWEEVPQLGSVVIGDDVEIGANTTIDRGAIGDTVLEDGVKLDNQIQIAHNCVIGRHTAIAACVGIAGSTRVGARCMIAGGAGLNGHIEIGDDVVIHGFAMVTKSLPGPGVYGSGLPVLPVREWRREGARVRRLGLLEERLAALEARLGIKRAQGGDEGGEPDV